MWKRQAKTYILRSMLGPDALRQGCLPIREGGEWPHKKRKYQESGLCVMTSPRSGQNGGIATREDLTALVQRLPDRPMTTTRLVTELKEIAELAKEPQLKEIYGAS